MAKKKIEAEVDETLAVQPENVEIAAEALAETEIPANVRDLLEVFKRYPELLITKDGGVFTPDTKLPNHKGAIIYKNPFYNS